jgi:hypothetical protein
MLGPTIVFPRSHFTTSNSSAEEVKKWGFEIASSVELLALFGGIEVLGLENLTGCGSLIGCPHLGQAIA